MTMLKSKLNGKKGFTLIEMLVVIAIIAVLVAIIIPTVSSATNKAAAATNAANLRSLKAEIVTEYLSNGEGSELMTIANDGAVSLSGITVPTMKAMKDLGDSPALVITYSATTKDFTLTYGGKGIDDFATYAEKGAWS